MRKVILCGNPNVGKTTLFNQLTNSNEKASNWHGVTVNVKEKGLEFDGIKYKVCDLPGIYSLNGVSDEEILASNYIKENLNEIVICVVDANNLKRNLLLALELKKLCCNILIAVNMANEVKNIDIDKLSQALGVQCVLVDARNKKGVTLLKSAIFNKINENNGAKFNIEHQNKNFKSFGFDRFENVLVEKFDFIDSVLKMCGYDKISNAKQKKIDNVLLHPIFAPVIFLCVMGIVFFVTFGFIGEYISGVFLDCLEKVFEGFFSIVFKSGNKFSVFAKEGLIGGIISVCGFLPQILIMGFFLNLMEEFGYLSRVSVMFDGYLKRVGLTGKSIFSLVMGFGCTSSAILTTRNVGSKVDRERTVLCLPFMSCSAKLPIYSVICSVFFSKNKFIFTFLLYIFAFLLFFFISFIFITLQKTQNKKYFMLELPKLRVPRLKKVFLDSLTIVKNFIYKIGFSIIICSVVIYFLYNYNFKLQFVSNKQESIIYIVADFFSFILAPIGLNMAGVMVALISGLIAKEMVVSTLVIVNGCSAEVLAESLLNPASAVHFTPLTAIVFLLFVLLYSPCISSLICVRKELGTKVMVKSFALQMVVAYVVSMIVYYSGCFILNGFWWLAVLFFIFVAIILFCMIKLLKRKKLKLNENQKCFVCKGESCGDCKL